MPKLLLNDTVKYFRDKGDLAINYNLIYWGARRGEIPCYFAGNRRIFDTEEVEKHFKKVMEDSMKQSDHEPVAIGKLRKVY